MRFITHHIIVSIFLFPAYLFAQDLTGLWKGYIYNDTTQQNYKYEVAISEKNGKLSGYSHTYFIIGNREYHGVKKVKISKQKDKIIIEDVGLIANNYPVQPPKGVHQLSALNFEMRDTVMILTGIFITTPTRQYHSITGFVHIERKKNYLQSALIPHLEELGLAKNLSFFEKVKTSPITKPLAASAPEETAKPITVIATTFEQRKTETIESVYYQSDSLTMALYDNGEVDGDTVSVYMNGKLLMHKIGLSTRAERKTIPTQNTGDSIKLVLFAENLGSLPPNTGLLVVYDGDTRYEIRFSGDMQKSAAIVFRKKK
jgi:hypothetical protein